MKLIQHISKTDSNQNQRDLSLTPFDINDFEKLLQNEDETFWMKKGEKKALKLFHEAAERVPAYKDFLKKHKINHESIRPSQILKKYQLLIKKIIFRHIHYLIDVGMENCQLRL
jgi:phenylacetate-coenzyme A ligase PaaK-like adenylate-forming protein